MNRIDKRFSLLRKSSRPAFIAFITAGYPNLKTTEQLIYEFCARGVDVIELGVPFSDPMADGPVIQASSQAALKNHVHLIDILKLVKKARKKSEIPICLMTYYNPIFCFGEAAFVKQAVASGVDGVIVPDLPPEEGRNFINLAKKSGLDTIFFVSPTTAKKRIKFIAQASGGFIYYVSLTGVTGARKKLPADLMNKLKEIKQITSKPVCAGFGISSAAQVKAIGKHCDGVIIGSAIVKKITENLKNKNLEVKVGAFVSNLKHG
jgi:tryptophan synthase alpha chain